MRIVATISVLAISFSSLAATAAIPEPGGDQDHGVTALQVPAGPAALPGGALDDKMPGVWFLRDSAPCFHWTGGPVTCYGVDVGEHTGRPATEAPGNLVFPKENPAGTDL